MCCSVAVTSCFLSLLFCSSSAGEGGEIERGPSYGEPCISQSPDPPTPSLFCWLRFAASFSLCMRRGKGWASSESLKKPFFSQAPPPLVPLYLPVGLMFAFPVRPAEEDADDDVESSSCLVNNFQEDAASLV